METPGTPENFVEIRDQKIELEGATLLHMDEIRKWAQFLSILGFVAIGLLILVGVIMFAVTSFRTAMSYDQLGMIGPLMGVFYLLFAAIYFFPVYYMYKFSRYAKFSLMQIGAGGPSNALMAQAIAYLKKHFRFVGIFTIVLLAVYLLGIIGLVIALAIR